MEDYAFNMLVKPSYLININSIQDINVICGMVLP